MLFLLLLLDELARKEPESRNWVLNVTSCTILIRISRQKRIFLGTFLFFHLQNFKQKLWMQLNFEFYIWQ